MPIRITGMNSGLDTESLVSALVMNYKTKVDKQKKSQQKLVWKTDAWKSVNTQINSLYSKVGNLRFTSAYATKKATASDTTKAKVTASSSAVNGTQKLVIKELAATGYLTGAKFNGNVKSSTKLSELDGFQEGKVTVGNGDKTTDIDVTGDMTVNDFVNKLKDAGLRASYDETNKRIFVSAQNSGKDNDFSLTASNEGGLRALAAMGLNVKSEKATAEYSALAAYAKTSGEEGSAVYDQDATIDNLKTILNSLKSAQADKKTAETANAYEKTALDYAKAYKTVNDGLSGDKETLVNDYISKYSQSDWDSKYVGPDGTVYDSREEVKNEDGEVTGYKYIKKATEEGGEDTTLEVGKDDTTVKSMRDKVEELATSAGLITTTPGEGGEEPTVDKTGLNDLVSAYNTMSSMDKKLSDGLEAYNTALGEYNNKMNDPELSEEEKAKLVEPTKSAELTNLEAAKVAVTGSSDLDAFITQTQTNIDNNDATIEAADATISKYSRFNSGAGMASYTDEQIADLAASWETKISMAYKAKNGQTGVAESTGAARVNGKDALIYLNDAEFTSNSNSFSINGLSIEAMATTSNEGITVTTSADTQGLYDKIKDFLSEYNDVVNSLMKQYNADSAKGYDPLTDEEKAEMTDKQVEQWETKIKNSILRRDQGLDGIIQSMTTSMFKSYDVNGTNYSLASFGIHTMGLASKKNENYAYHIDGDEDDMLTSTASDKLMKALSEDPDSVVEFMKKLTSGLYDSVGKNMRSTRLKSAYTVYNDKEMATEYSDYTKNIKKWEQKLEDAESRYYKQFTKMEKALAKLNANNSQLGGMLGG